MENSVLQKRLDATIMAQRIITENNYVIEQPTVQGIVDILNNVIRAETDIPIEIGKKISSEELGHVFGRKPQTEGINYCKKILDCRSNPLI